MKFFSRFVAALALIAAAQPAAEGRRQNPPAGNPQQPSQQTPTQPPADQPASQQQTQQPPTIRTGINYVRVDAIVTDKDGKPVLDLTQDDFTVSEDGKPQRVDSFSVVKLDVAETTENAPPRAIRSDYDEEREAARPDVRLFVILLDDYHVKRGNDLAVKKPLIDFIQNQLGPADMLAIMYPLTPIEDIRFSRDRDGAISAIEHFEGRKFDYRPRNQLEEKYAMYPAQTVERVRNQITMDALKAAGFRMGALREGRKSIIFVSEGFMSLLPSQLSDPVASMPGYGNPNRGNAGAVQATPQQQMTADVDMLSDMNRMYGDLNRQNTSVYPVDPRGLAPFEYDVNQGIGLQQDAKSLRETLDSLHSLAANTDGRAIVDRNDLATGMKQIIRDSSGYYLLGYNSTQAPMDGKFHAIKVSVKRRGLDVRARKGYWAYTADDVARAESRKKTEVATPVTTALTDLAAPLRDRTAHFWIGTSRAADGKTKVTFVWEPAAAVPGQPHDQDPASRVSLTAIAPDGRPVFRGKLPEDVAPSAKGGSATFDAAPGRLNLKMIVEGSHGQVIDSVNREVTVPDFSTVTMSFATPRVYRVRTLPELQAIKNNPDALPTSEREFSRSDRLYIRAEAYAPGGMTPPVTARLLNRSGQSMADLPVQQRPGKPSEIELPLSAFAAGEYLIELDAKSEGGSTAQELIAFRISR
jgi:VWFA-related protein